MDFVLFFNNFQLFAFLRRHVAEKGVRSLLSNGSIIGDHHRTQGFQGSLSWLHTLSGSCDTSDGS